MTEFAARSLIKILPASQTIQTYPIELRPTLGAAAAWRPLFRVRLLLTPTCPRPGGCAIQDGRAAPARSPRSPAACWLLRGAAQGESGRSGSYRDVIKSRPTHSPLPTCYLPPAPHRHPTTTAPPTPSCVACVNGQPGCCPWCWVPRAPNAVASYRSAAAQLRQSILRRRGGRLVVGR